MQTPISVKSPTQTRRESAKLVARALLGSALGFRDCRPETLDALVASGNVRHLGKGELLARRGAPFDALCLVIDGWIESSMTYQDGHRQLVSYLQVGDVAGMISVLDGLGHVNDLRARDAATVMMIAVAEVHRLRAQDPALVHAFELQLAFRSRLLYERLSCDPTLPIQVRLCRLLQILGGLYGVMRNGQTLLNVKISQSDLADWLGASRQSINFALQKLKDENLIKVQYSTLTIIDSAGLAARASP